LKEFAFFCFSLISFFITKCILDTCSVKEPPPSGYVSAGGGIYLQWTGTQVESIFLKNVFFIRCYSRSYGLDIGGMGNSTAAAYNKMNDSSIIKCRSLSKYSNIKKFDVGGQNKSNLLPDYLSSPIYVAQLSTKDFYIANKQYCGSEEVRCITLTYALTVLDPSADYILYMENGFYYESPVSIQTNKNFTIIGSSIKYTLVSIYNPQIGFFFFFLFLFLFLFFFFF
jgi:hypothetical protein